MGDKEADREQRRRMSHYELPKLLTEKNSKCMSLLGEQRKGHSDMRRAALFLTIILFLGGCDLLGGNASSTDSAANSAPTATTVPDAATATPGPVTATDTPMATATSTSYTTLRACAKKFPTDGQYGYIGDMLISQPHFGGLSYLGLRLPDNIPGGMPYRETNPTSTILFAGGVKANPSPTVLADPYLSNGLPVLGYRDSGFVVEICNNSPTASHTLQELGIQIASFTAATGSNLNIQNGCDQAISAKQGPVGGCGGSIAAVDGFTATWPLGTSPGTTLKLAQKENTQSSLGGGYANLPVTLKPGATYIAYIGMNYPGQPGSYAFQFGMQVDSVPLAIVGGTSYPLFMAPTAHLWSGGNCWNNATWKQMVLASTSGYYVCP